MGGFPCLMRGVSGSGQVRYSLGERCAWLSASLSVTRSTDVARGGRRPVWRERSAGGQQPLNAEVLPASLAIWVMVVDIARGISALRCPVDHCARIYQEPLCS